MGDRTRRLSSYVGTPWASEPASESAWRADPNEPVLARFTGLWTTVDVTANWIKIRSPTRDLAVSLAEVKTVDAGFDPSPHDSGGPFWGIWITMTSGREHGAQISRPRDAAALIFSLRRAARERKAGQASRPPAPADPGAHA
jgi:hypothetical protein